MPETDKSPFTSSPAETQFASWLRCQGYSMQTES